MASLATVAYKEPQDIQVSVVTPATLVCRALLATADSVGLPDSREHQATQATQVPTELKAPRVIQDPVVL